MSAKVKTIGDVAVLSVKGNLMGGSETEECHVKIKELIGQGMKKVVVDLSGAKWVNSRGLGMMIACYTSLKNASGDFKICCATEKVRSLLTITKLVTIFETYDDVNKAVRSFT